MGFVHQSSMIIERIVVSTNTVIEFDKYQYALRNVVPKTLLSAKKQGRKVQCLSEIFVFVYFFYFIFETKETFILIPKSLMESTRKRKAKGLCDFMRKKKLRENG